MGWLHRQWGHTNTPNRATENRVLGRERRADARACVTALLGYTPSKAQLERWLRDQKAIVGLRKLARMGGHMRRHMQIEAPLVTAQHKAPTWVGRRQVGAGLATRTPQTPPNVGLPARF